MQYDLGAADVHGQWGSGRCKRQGLLLPGNKHTHTTPYLLRANPSHVNQSKIK